jgi:hypothetical protein
MAPAMTGARTYALKIQSWRVDSKPRAGNGGVSTPLRNEKAVSRVSFRSRRVAMMPTKDFLNFVQRRNPFRA